jgi:predicted nucleic acid-binding protein
MWMVDASVWVDVLRDRDGHRTTRLRALLGDDAVTLARPTELELLQGARDEREWSVLEDYLKVQEYLEPSPASWSAAARLYFELRRRGVTIRSTVNCLVAQIALEHEAGVLHRDRDFEAIARVRPLVQRWVDW